MGPALEEIKKVHMNFSDRFGLFYKEHVVVCLLLIHVATTDL